MAKTTLSQVVGIQGRLRDEKGDEGHDTGPRGLKRLTQRYNI